MNPDGELEQLLHRLSDEYWEDMYNQWGDLTSSFCKLCDAYKDEGHKTDCLWSRVLEMIRA